MKQAGFGVAAAGHALDDRAVGDEGAAGVAPALGPVRGLVLPVDLAGLGVQRDDVGIRGREDDVVAVDRHVALGEVVAAGVDQLLRQLALVLPEQVAGGRVQRLHLVAVVEDEEHAVVYQRRRLGGAGRQRPHPSDAQVLDVVLVDLVERRIAPAVVGAPPHQPVAVVGRLEHLVRYRPDRVERVRGLVLRHRRRAAEHDEGGHECGGFQQLL